MNSVIILMAGKGQRTGLQNNKALTKINNKPLFMYSLETFYDLDIEIVLVINKLEEETIKEYTKDLDIKIAYGGNSRSESSYNGLLCCKGEYVLIHDAARPFIKKQVIEEALLSKPRPSLVCSDSVNTIKIINSNGIETLDRTKLIVAETPQGAMRKDFLLAYEKAYKSKLSNTDDISLIERYITSDIRLIKTVGNNKITTPEDVVLAKVRLGEVDV